MREQTAFPTLNSSRLTLRKVGLADVPQILNHANNKAISENTLNIPYPYGEGDALLFLSFVEQGFRDQQRYVFAITLNTGDEMIGAMGLHLEKKHNRAELGYWLGEAFWNRGIISEAIGVVLRFGFEQLQLNKIYATCFDHNPASARALVKNNMILEGEWKEHILKNNVYMTFSQYRLTKKEYENL